MISDIYYYKDKPLQKSYNNTYTPPEKIEINQKLESDYSSGMLSFDQMYLIINDGLYGSFTCMRIIDKLMFDKKVKVNPITLDKRTFNTIKKPFDF
jgi:hypothetical protein